MATSAAGWFFKNKVKFSVCQLQDLAMDISGRCIPGILNGLQVMAVVKLFLQNGTPYFN